MKFTEEQIECVEADYNSEEHDIEIIEEGDWIQDYKMQYKETIFKHAGKYYSYTQERSGSVFSDWQYEDPEDPVEVEKVEVVIAKWRAVA